MRTKEEIQNDIDKLWERQQDLGEEYIQGYVSKELYTAQVAVNDAKWKQLYKEMDEVAEEVS